METTQQLSNNQISWPAVYIAAESEQEPFTNLTVVTAKSELLVTARSAALTELLKKNNDVSPESIDRLARQLVDNKIVEVYEHAHILDDSTVVCMDIEVIDDDSIWQALDIVYDAISNGGNWISKQPVSYAWLDLI